MQVRAACEALRAAALPGLLDLTPAYTTVLATFDLRRMTPDAETLVRSALSGIRADHRRPGRRIDVPVCYGGVHGEDLATLAETCGLTSAEAVELHCGVEYEVAFIGFAPGFAYMHGLPEKLATPRLSSPRTRVAAGSVGIAGGQTGLYPGGTPGGWRLIGRTPLRVFDADREPAALLAMGDRVRFVPISQGEFERRHGLEERGR